MASGLDRGRGRLRGVRMVLLDIDGTIYEGSRPVPGAADAVGWLRGSGRTLRFTTNTDSIGPAALADRLVKMGVTVHPAELVTPVQVAAGLFGRLGDAARILPLTSPAVREILAVHLAGPGDRVTHVLVADPSYGVTYAELDAAFHALRAGARLVATQLGRFVRRDDGWHLDAGGFVRLLEFAAEVEAQLLGKPSPAFFGVALEAAGCPAEAALVVGDDVRSDVAGGRAVGARTVLVRTGKGTQPAPGAPEPDLVIDTVADLPALLAGAD